MKRLVDFTVVGTGRFPIDMLRYDGAWPATGEAAGSIEASFEPGARKRQIKLRAINAPTEARWASFGWSVISS